MLIKNFNFEDTITSHKNNSIKRIILKKGFFPGLLQIAIGKLLKGQEIETHSHESMNEFFFLLEGNLEFNISNKIAIVEQKDLVVVKKRRLHSIKAIIDSEFLYFNLEDNT